MDSADRLAYWINERERMRVKKEDGYEPPWTKDPIMASTRWCNVHREDDKVTRWLRQNYLNPAQAYGGDEATYFASAVGRFINWPSTLKMIRLRSWDPDQFLRIMDKRRLMGRKVFGGAYVISTNGRPMAKDAYVAELLTRFREFTPYLGKIKNLAACYNALITFDGIGSFMAGQIIADCKNTPGHSLKSASDWWEWCCPGPGSKKGLNYYFGRDPESPMGEKEFYRLINRVRAEVFDLVEVNMHMQDLQNCLCEFGKYERIRHGGRAKTRYDARPTVRSQVT